MAVAEQTERAAIERVREHLHQRYDRAVAPSDVDRVLRGAQDRFRGSRVRTFVPILVERRVRAEFDRRLPGAGG